MKIIFVRHAEPDYSVDGLTEKGKREAALLAERFKKWKDISEIYVSPLGRAKETASYSLKASNLEGIEVSWLEEFYHPVGHPDNPKTHVPWDYYPTFWKNEPCVYDKDKWTEFPFFEGVDIKGFAETVYEGFDKILEKHGAVRNGNGYEAVNVKENDTIVFFCHLGVTGVCLGRLLNISPFLLWHSTYLAPSSVTIVGAEIRDGKNIGFRTQVIGDTSHLIMCGEPVSSSGYFTDTFND